MEQLQELFELLTNIEIGSYSDPFKFRTGPVSGWQLDDKRIIRASCSTDRDYCTMTIEFKDDVLELMQHDTHDCEDDDRYAGDFPLQREDGSLEVICIGGPCGGKHERHFLKRI